LAGGTVTLPPMDTTSADKGTAQMRAPVRRGMLVITIMAEEEQFKFSVPAYRGSEVKQFKRGRSYLKRLRTKSLWINQEIRESTDN